MHGWRSDWRATRLLGLLGHLRGERREVLELTIDQRHLLRGRDGPAQTPARTQTCAQLRIGAAPSRPGPDSSIRKNSQSRRLTRGCEMDIVTAVDAGA